MDDHRNIDVDNNISLLNTVTCSVVYLPYTYNCCDLSNSTQPIPSIFSGALCLDGGRGHSQYAIPRVLW